MSSTPSTASLPSTSQGVGDGARDADAELAASVARQVVVRRLIDVERVDVVLGHVQLAVAGVAVEEAAGDVVGSATAAGRRW